MVSTPVKNTIPVSSTIGRLKPSTALRYWIPRDGTQAARSTNCSPPWGLSYRRKTTTESTRVRPENAALTHLTACLFSSGTRRITSSPVTQLSRMAVR